MRLFFGFETDGLMALNKREKKIKFAFFIVYNDDSENGPSQLTTQIIKILLK